jgi:hypothetical protein
MNYLAQLSDYSNIALEKTTLSSNYLLGFNYLRIYLLMISGVFMGYTLQPVPKWLNKLFDTSNLLKFMILFIAGSIALYPLDTDKFLWVLVGSFATIAVFELMRKYEKKSEEKDD